MAQVWPWADRSRQTPSFLHPAFAGVNGLSDDARFLPDTPPWPAVTFLVSAPNDSLGSDYGQCGPCFDAAARIALYALLRFATRKAGRGLLLAALQVGLLWRPSTWDFSFSCGGDLAGDIPSRRRGLRQASSLCHFSAGVSLLNRFSLVRAQLEWPPKSVFPESMVFSGLRQTAGMVISDTGLKSFWRTSAGPRTVLNFPYAPLGRKLCNAALYDGTIGPIFLLLLPALLSCRPPPPVVRLGLGGLTTWCFGRCQSAASVAIPHAGRASACRTGRCVILPLISLLADGAGMFGRTDAERGIDLLVLLNVPPFHAPAQRSRGLARKVMHPRTRRCCRGRVSADNYLASTVRPTPHGGTSARTFPRTPVSSPYAGDTITATGCDPHNRSARPAGLCGSHPVAVKLSPAVEGEDTGVLGRCDRCTAMRRRADG